MKIFSLFLIIVLLSCQSSENEKDNSKTINTDSDKNKTYKLIAKDTFNLQIDNKTSYKNIVSVIKIGRKRFFFSKIHRQNRCILWDFKTLKKVKEITFEKEGPNGVGNIQDIVFYKWDSIFILKSYSKNIFLVDSSGKVKNKWNMHKKTKYIFESTASSISYPLELFNSKLYFGKIPPYNPESYLFFKDTMQIIYDIRTSNVINKTVMYPNIYQQGTYYGIYNFTYERIINKHGQTVASFSLDDNLYLYNDTLLLNKYSFKSKHVLSKPPTPKSDLSSVDDCSRYELQKGSYRYLRYDKYNDIIYRVVLHKSEIYDINGNLVEVFSKPFSIQVINKDFELILEQEFPGNTYLLRNIIAVKEGLLISTSNDNNPSLKEDRSQFILFSLNKI